MTGLQLLGYGSNFETSLHYSDICIGKADNKVLPTKDAHLHWSACENVIVQSTKVSYNLELCGVDMGMCVADV